MALRPENLPRDPDRLIEMVLASEGKIEALQATIAKLRTIIFGARSEKSVVIIAEQLSLALGAIEAGVAAPTPANDDGQNAERGNEIAPETRKKRNRNIGALPEHLPRVERRSSRRRRSARAARADASDRRRLRAKRSIGFRRCCGCCARSAPNTPAAPARAPIVQAKAPARLIEGGMATTALVAHIAVGQIRLAVDALSPDADPRGPWRRHRSPDAGALDEAGGVDGEGPL